MHLFQHHVGGKIFPGNIKENLKNINIYIT